MRKQAAYGNRIKKRETEREKKKESVCGERDGEDERITARVQSVQFKCVCVCVCVRVCVCVCGVVLCGVVWCGVVWCGVVWCGVVV